VLPTLASALDLLKPGLHLARRHPIRRGDDLMGFGKGLADGDRPGPAPFRRVRHGTLLALVAAFPYDLGSPRNAL